MGGERGRGGDIAPPCYCRLTPQVDIILCTIEVNSSGIYYIVHYVKSTRYDIVVHYEGCCFLHNLCHTGHNIGQ